MSTETWAAILAAVGIGTIISAIISGYFSRRKVGAEATEIITKAAAGVVTNMQAEIDRQVKRNEQLVRDHRDEVKMMIESHGLEMEEVRRVLQLHVAWDAIAIAKMAELGIDLPPAPPLLPARRHYPHHELTVDLRDHVNPPPQEAL